MMKLAAVLLVVGSATSVVAAPQPEITAPALLPRANPGLIGWYSVTTLSGQTVYQDWLYDRDQSTMTTSSRWFRPCQIGLPCNIYTGCSNGWGLSPVTSQYCGVGGTAGASICSSDVLMASMGAPDIYTMYWCDSATITGKTFYETRPSNAYVFAGSTPAPSSIAGITGLDFTSAPPSPTSTSPRNTGSAPPSSTPTTGPTDAPGTDSSPKSKKAPVGAIAGGAAGGVVLLAAIAAGIFFLARRGKKKPEASTTAAAAANNTAPAPPPAQQWNPQSPTLASPPPPGYATPFPLAQEQKVPEMQTYAMSQAQYPQGVHEMHVEPQQQAQQQQFQQSPPQQFQHHAGAPVQHGLDQRGSAFIGELPADSRR